MQERDRQLTMRSVTAPMMMELFKESYGWNLVPPRSLQRLRAAVRCAEIVASQAVADRVKVGGSETTFV